MTVKLCELLEKVDIFAHPVQFQTRVRAMARAVLLFGALCVAYTLAGAHSITSGRILSLTSSSSWANIWIALFELSFLG